MKNLNFFLQKLFHEKKYSEIINTIQNEIKHKDYSAGILNILGVSIILQGPKTKQVYKLAMSNFRESYFKEKQTLIGLDGLINLMNTTVDFFDARFSTDGTDDFSIEFDNLIFLFEEARVNFGNNYKLINAAVRIYKRTNNIDKALFFLKILVESDSPPVNLICSYIFLNCYSKNWSQKDYFINSKLLEIHSKKFSEVNLKKFKTFKKKKIRVGFLSADIKQGHSVTYFLKTVLKYYDKDKFEIYLFLNNKNEDATTLVFKNIVDETFNIKKLSDLDALNYIREQNVDIMFDLMGVTSDNRIELFKNRLSAIQISWLGHLNTTGLDNMDYILSDPNLILEDEKKLYSENVISLPNIWNCHSGVDKKFEKNNLPYDTNNFITFGSLNNFAKINEDVLETWAQILNKIENSCLILKSSIKRETKFIKKFFEKKGVLSSLKIYEFINSKEDHLNIYKDIDICLDTFPWNGVTTSFEAIWMGVPVLTMKGHNFQSRTGQSINKNLGLEELISDNMTDYVNKAVNLSQNIKHLKSLRNHIYDTALKSPLFNKKKYSDDFYKILKEVFEKNFN